MKNKVITISMELNDYQEELEQQLEIGQTTAYNEIRKALKMNEQDFRIKLAEIIEELGTLNQKYYLFKELYSLCGHGTYQTPNMEEAGLNAYE